MYPFKPGHLFVRNAWYVAALSDEIDETFFERRILGDSVLLYRTMDGTAVALQGLCPHRRLPLRLGTRIGNGVQCGYHGITFDSDGRCVRIPSQSRPTEQMRLKSYPLVERWRWLWIWPGDPNLADESLIPDHAELGLSTGWAPTPPHHCTASSRYQLLIENLLDLSHISFLHGSYIQDDAWFTTPVRTERQGKVFIASRRTPDSARSDFHSWMFPEAPDRLDQDLRTVFLGPNLTYSGPVVRGLDGRYMGSLNAIHAITPETARSTHYFSTTTRDFRIGDAPMTSELREMDIGVRRQDVVALEAIETELSDEDTLAPEISIQADTPALQVRRIVETLIALEKISPA